MNRWVPCPKWSLMFFSLVKGRPSLFIHCCLKRSLLFEKRLHSCNAMKKKRVWKWGIKKNEWHYKHWTRGGAPQPRQAGRCCLPDQEWWEIILGFNCTAEGPFTSLPNIRQTSPRVCQLPSLTLPCLEENSSILGKINRRGLLLHSPDGLFTPPSPPSGVLAQASASLIAVKLILEHGHHKINNEIITVPQHLDGLVSPYQRADSRGHVRPPGDIPSSLLPSPAPYITDLITCETQSRGLWCYPITKSRFIWTWEA